MQRILRTLIVICILGSQNGLTARADDFDLYYLGGQSNMEGFGTVSELKESDKGFVNGAYIFHSTPQPDKVPIDGYGIWAPLQPGHGTDFKTDGKANQLSNRFGCEMTFARTLRRIKPDRKIAIIKYARNGSSIDSRAAGDFGCWQPDFDAASGENRYVNQYDQFLATIEHALEIHDIDGDGTTDRLIPAGIVWMQGESDAANTESVAVDYEMNLNRLMDLIRAALHRDDVPVVLGRISDSKKGLPDAVWKFGDVVREAQSTFTKTDRRATIVTSTDNYKYSDRWHYDSEGYLDLGEEFAKAVISIPKK